MLDFLEEANELNSLLSIQSFEEFRHVLKILGKDGVHKFCSLRREMDGGEATVAEGGTACDEPVFFEVVQQAGDGSARDSCLLRKGGGCLGLIRMPVEEHEDGEAPLTEHEAGERLGFRCEDQIARVEEMKEGCCGRSIQIGVTGGSLKEAIEPGQFSQEQKRHGLFERRLGD